MGNRVWTARWRLAGLAIFCALATTTLIDPLAFMYDDSWFYVVIGKNLARGFGPTFNGVTDTNGFQPLWQAIVACVVWLGKLLGVDSPQNLARLAISTGWALLAVALWRLQHLLGSLGSGRTGRIAAFGIVLAYLSGFTGTIGSEANLVALTLVVSIELMCSVARFDSRLLRKSAVLGIMCGLTVLARLDMILLIPAMVIGLLAGNSSERADRTRSAITVAAVSAAVIAPYLLWNLVQFGNLIPISGAIKLSGADTAVSPDLFTTYGVAMVLAAGVVGLFAFWHRRGGSEALSAWAVPFACAVLSVSLYSFRSNGAVTDLAWYRVPALVALAIGTAAASTRFVTAPTRWPRFLVAGVVTAVLAVLVWANVALRIGGTNGQIRHGIADFADEVRHTTKQKDVVIAADDPGVIAAFSDRSVVAIDGLTGNFAFQDDLVDLGAACTVAQLGATWFAVEPDRIVGAYSSEPAVQVYSWLHKQPAGNVYLDPNGPRISDSNSGWDLWRIDPQCRR